jgi:hypothetical protein
MRLLATAATLGLIALRSTGAAAQQPAPAEDPRPRAALGACSSGDVKRGVAILAELYAETRNPSFVFNQARCYQQNGQLEPARQRFDEYLRVGKNEPPDDLQRAQGYIKEIDDALARQPPPPAPAPVIINNAPAPAPGAAEGRARYLRGTGIALTVLGLAAVGTGVYLSFKVQSTTHDVENRFANMGIVTDPGSLQRELTDGGRYETWQWVAYGVGVAAFAGAATTFLLGGFPFSGGHAAPESSATTTATLAPIASPGNLGGVLRLRF